MINKIKDWLYWNAPIITTRWKRCDYVNALIKDALKVDHIKNKMFIDYIMKDINELRKNTWDIKRVDFISAKLKSYFEVKDENN